MDRNSSKISKIIKEAEGEIDENLLTQSGEGGIISTGYLRDIPLIEYLDEDETLGYLFENHKKGIKAQKDDETQTLKPDSNYRTVAAITSRRVLFVIGQSSGDEVIEVPLSSVKNATTHSGLRTDRLEIETPDGIINFYLKSNPETADAAEYITQNIPASTDRHDTPQYRETQSTSNTADSDTVTNESTATANGGSDLTSNHERTDTDSEVTAIQESQTSDIDQSSFDVSDIPQIKYIDQKAVANEQLKLVQKAEIAIRSVGTEIEDIDEAQDQLTRAHNKLCKALSAGGSGVSDDRLSQRISEIEHRLEALQTISKIIKDAQDIKTDTEDNVNTKLLKYTTALSTAEEAGLSLTEVKEELSDLKSKQQAISDETEISENGTNAESDETTTTVQATPGESETEDSGTDSLSETRAEMIADIESVASELGRIPRYNDMHEHGEFKAQEYSQEFGSWDQALEATDIDVEQRLIDSIENVGNQFNRAPTKSEVDELGKYDSDWYSKHFSDFDAALSAAGLEKPSLEALLDELQRLQNELGCPPTSHHVENHGNYPVSFYRSEFGSVRKAAEQAGMDYEGAVIDAVRAIGVGLRRRPKLSEFNEYAQYSSSFVYNHFDGWSDACAAAGVDTDVEEFVAEQSASEIRELFDRAPIHESLPEPDIAEVDTSSTEKPVASSGDIEPSPLAEYYEVFGNLNKVQETMLGENIAESIGETLPMARWHTLVQDRWAGDSPTSLSESYGSQQYGESELAITDYRDAFGNGDAVTDFQAIETAALPTSVAELLSNLSEMDQSEAAKIKIPKAPNSGVPLPVFVESEAEYERAKGLLEEFPERPPTKIELSGEGGGSKPEPPEGQDEREEDPKSSGDLTELGGITSSIAAALRSAGYESKEDLKEADKGELMQIEGIESQQANRIKLLVGG